MSQPDSDAQVSAVRAFNRFYTRKLGVLDQQLLKSPFSLSEARVLYELAHRGNLAAKEIGIELGLDPGYLSRIVQKFDEDGLITRKPLAADRRQYQLSLTAKGRQAFAKTRAQLAGRRRFHARSPVPGRRGAPDRGDDRNRASARRTTNCTATRDPARSPPRRHGLGGAEPRRIVRARIRFRLVVRSVGGGDIGQIPRLLRRLARALLDRRHRRQRRSARSFWSGTPTTSPSCDCCWWIRPGADRDWGGGWSESAFRSRRHAAIAGSRCGRRAFCSPRATSIRMPASCWSRPIRTAVLAKA